MTLLNTMNLTKLVSWLPVLALSIVLGPALPSATATTPPVPTCFGEPATITGVDEIEGTPGPDVIVATVGEFGTSVHGRGGNDLICGADFAYGEKGDDKILFNTPGVAWGELFGGAGADRIFWLTVGRPDIDGGSGDDFIATAGGAQFISGDTGNDEISAGRGSDDVSGGPGNDLIKGGVGNDHLFGDAGDDDLAGGDGADDLDGGHGEDIGRGGPGADECRRIEASLSC
jgi:Ca2+-binding RTX toxin-like protein